MIVMKRFHGTRIGDERTCRKCGASIIATRLMVKRHEYLCAPCRKADPNRNAAYQRQWYQKNKVEQQRKAIAYRQANREVFRQASREWRARNPNKVSAIEQRRKLKKYKLTADEHERLLTAQGGKCAACRCDPPQKKKWKTGEIYYSLEIDHDHSTGAVRGLLCLSCNTILGNARDNPGTLQQLIDYLQRTTQCRKISRL